MSKVWQYLKQHAYGALTIVTVLLCILGSCIANLAQTDFGNVTKENLTIETSSGHRLGINMPPTTSRHPPSCSHMAATVSRKSGIYTRSNGHVEASSCSPSIFTDTATPRF